MNDGDLQRAFGAMPEAPDDGFTERVAARIAAHQRAAFLRDLVVAGSFALAGAAVARAIWPLLQQAATELGRATAVAGLPFSGTAALFAPAAAVVALAVRRLAR